MKDLLRKIANVFKWQLQSIGTGRDAQFVAESLNVIGYQFFTAESHAVPIYKLLLFMNLGNSQMFIREYRDRISMTCIIYISPQKKVEKLHYGNQDFSSKNEYKEMRFLCRNRETRSFKTSHTCAETDLWHVEFESIKMDFLINNAETIESFI